MMIHKRDIAQKMRIIEINRRKIYKTNNLQSDNSASHKSIKFFN